MQFILHSIDDLMEQKSYIMDTVVNVKRVDYMSEYQYVLDSYEGEDLKKLNLLYKIASNFNKVEKTIESLDDLRSKLMALLDSLQPDYRAHTEKVETLYHTTAYLKEILKDGFSAEKPVDRKGVGNFGTQSLISFTHDPGIAISIMRALKECVLIIKGELKPATILAWLVKDSKDRDSLEQIKKHLYYNHNIENGVPTTIEQKLQMYNYYLWTSKTRVNPVLTNLEDLAKSLQGRTVNDIGILKCQVDLSDPSIKYFQAEREYRVSPQNVLKVEQYL